MKLYDKIFNRGREDILPFKDTVDNGFYKKCLSGGKTGEADHTDHGQT
jgi:hypothetical protein